MKIFIPAFIWKNAGQEICIAFSFNKNQGAIGAYVFEGFNKSISFLEFLNLQEFLSDIVISTSKDTNCEKQVVFQKV